MKKHSHKTDWPILINTAEKPITTMKPRQQLPVFPFSTTDGGF